MDDVFGAAQKLLAIRPRSEAEVRRRLSRRFCSSLVEAAIVALRRQGLLDDAAFAAFWRQNREQHRPRSASAIRWELLRMGVSRDVVDQSLEGLDEEEAAYHAAEGLVRRTTRPDYPTFRKKLFAHLRRRGFGGEAIRVTIQRMWQELPDPADSHIEGTAPPEQPE